MIIQNNYCCSCQFESSRFDYTDACLLLPLPCWIFIPMLFVSPAKHSWLILGVTPGQVAQSVPWMTIDACLTADQGVVRSIHARSHSFMEIDYEIISTVILPSADSFKKGWCRFTRESMCMKYWLITCSSLPRKKGVVRWTDHPNMTIVIDWEVKQLTKQTNS